MWFSFVGCVELPCCWVETRHRRAHNPVAENPTWSDPTWLQSILKKTEKQTLYEKKKIKKCVREWSCTLSVHPQMLLCRTETASYAVWLRSRARIRGSPLQTIRSHMHGKDASISVFTVTTAALSLECLGFGFWLIGSCFVFCNIVLCLVVTFCLLLTGGQFWPFWCPDGKMRIRIWIFLWFYVMSTVTYNYDNSLIQAALHLEVGGVPDVAALLLLVAWPAAVFRCTVHPYCYSTAFNLRPLHFI